MASEVFLDTGGLFALLVPKDPRRNGSSRHAGFFCSTKTTVFS